MNTQVPEDDDLPPFVPPDEELITRIVNQVEFYFSDVNITKDAFLLKHVKRNREGYVSLKLISSFKRVKHIARDWRVVAYALRRSTKLEVNEAGTKLRRKDPLPAYDQTTPSRTVVAVDLPLEKPTIESVAELFRPCGDIALVRILRPGNPIPADVRAFVARHPEMHGVVSALVEFVRTESALNAVARPPADVAVLALNSPGGTSPSPVNTTERVRRKAQPRKHILGRYEPDYSSSDAELEQRLLALAAQRRGSTPMDCTKHWLQRRYSRDSGCEDMGGYHRRMSAGWESGGSGVNSGSNSASDYASRSRSNSGASIPEFLARRLSTGWDSGSGSESCCSGRSSRSNSFLMDSPTRRYSYGKDSDSDGYGSFRSRRSSAGSDVGGPGSGLGRRMSDGFSDCCGPRRHAPPHVLLEQQLARRVAALGLGDGHTHDYCGCHCRMAPPPPPMGHHHHHQDCFGRRSSSGSFPLERKPSFGEQRRPGNLTSSHMPDNVTRMPRGPDGGRGFMAPKRENDIPEVC